MQNDLGSTALVKPLTYPDSAQGMLILVLGEPGSGKSTALRNLNPDTTFIINCLNKPLPFPGGLSWYSIEKENLEVTTSWQSVIKILTALPKDKPHITDIVIDDGGAIMMEEFVKGFQQKLGRDGVYQMYRDLAIHTYRVLQTPSSLSRGIRVFYLAHEHSPGDSGKRIMKTVGAMTEDKLTPEGLTVIVLYSEVFVNENGEHDYVFYTQTDGFTRARSPMGMFPYIIPNDLSLVAQRIDEYYLDGVQDWQDSSVSFDAIDEPKLVKDRKRRLLKQKAQTITQIERAKTKSST